MKYEWTLCNLYVHSKSKCNKQPRFSWSLIYEKHRGFAPRLGRVAPKSDTSKQQDSSFVRLPKINYLCIVMYKQLTSEQRSQIFALLQKKSRKRDCSYCGHQSIHAFLWIKTQRQPIGQVCLVQGAWQGHGASKAFHQHESFIEKYNNFALAGCPYSAVLKVTFVKFLSFRRRIFALLLKVYRKVR